MSEHVCWPSTSLGQWCLYFAWNIWDGPQNLLECFQGLVHSENISQHSSSLNSSFIPLKTMEKSTLYVQNWRSKIGCLQWAQMITYCSHFKLWFTLPVQRPRQMYWNFLTKHLSLYLESVVLWKCHNNKMHNLLWQKRTPCLFCYVVTITSFSHYQQKPQDQPYSGWSM